MNFGDALEYCKRGFKMSRKGWNGKGQYVVLAYMKELTTSNGVTLQYPEHECTGSKFLLFVGTSGYQCGWLASQADMLAEDWVVSE